MKIKIFYSWQMTTDTKYNKFFILDCIRKSVKKLKNKPEFKDVDFEVQEGISGESGAVQVASKIVDERIPKCDIFISDLSVVNPISRLGKKLQGILGDSYKPFQNNNVTYEFGVAYDSVGEQKIISVLNKAYGSPNDNPANIPFDLTHLRFPIEYTYSKKYNNKEKASQELVSKLIGAIRDTARFALANQKNKYYPLLVWKDWERIVPTSQKYYTNGKIDEIESIIKDIINQPQVSVRLLGLSGLGKTRILLEIFRTEDVSSELNSRVLYINHNDYQDVNYHTLFHNLKQGDENPIVIIDNCPITLHRSLLKHLINDENKISLITVNSNPEEVQQDTINDIKYILIKKEDLTSVVSNILDDEFAVIGEENIKKTKEFSQGIPLMAVLIGESIKRGEKFIGKIDDKELLNKLLGEKGQDSRIRTILKSCSIFNYIGNDGEVSSQLDFVATNKDITSLNGDSQVLINEFNDTCKFYLKREIFETKGRFIGMRPFPLAMSLTQEWLEPCTDDRIIRVLTAIANLKEPHRKLLTKALSERMKYLGYDDNANLIIENIVGPNRPFDNAEVLNTELGSRLFRSFVEVNPVAISNNLVRQYSSKSKNELLEVKEGRRNLVWVLEKLCFDKRTFSESIKILFSFAVAENETWSNNATGQLMQLFNVQLAGTEADLEERWKIINWALTKGDEEYKNLALKAMDVGLGFGHGTRMIGAEIQGTKKLVDYIPTKTAVVDYWNNILSTLTEYILSNTSDAEYASKTISNKIRGICRARLADVIFPYLDKIIDFKKQDWDELLIALKQVKKYDKPFLTKEQFEKVEGYIASLTKTDFLTRYLTTSRLYHLDEDESFSKEKVIVLLEKLADEFIESNLPWEEYLPVFYQNQQVFSYHFGKRLYLRLKDQSEKTNKFISQSISVIESIPKDKRNVLVLGGFINEANKELQSGFYKSLIDKELNYLLFYFISINPSGKEYFQILLGLVASEACNVSEFSSLSYGSAIEKMNKLELEEFSAELFKYGSEGYSVVFDLYFSIGYHNQELKVQLKPIYEKCIIELGVNKSTINQLDDYKWSQTICFILSDISKKDFAQFINNSIIESISFNNSYHLDHYMQEIYEVMLKNHFNNIWPDLSNALLFQEEKYEKFYGLKHILGSHIGGVGRSIGVLFVGDIDAIFKWCQENKSLAPARLAELVPIYDNDNTDYSSWHPIALRLIDEFGDIEEVLSNLSSNMGTYSWVGSLVPLLEAKKELFNKIKNHKLSSVADWANRYLKYSDEEIKREKTRDEEMYL